MADNTEEVIENEVVENDIDPFATREIDNNKPEPIAETKEVEAVKEDTPAAEANKEEQPPKEVEPTVEPKENNIDFTDLLGEREDEIFSYLTEKRTLSTADKLTPEEQIKLNLKYQNPDFSTDEIEGLFHETFERPEKPEQTFDELDEDFEARVAKWEKKNKTFDNKISREAKVALKQLTEKYNELPKPSIKAANEPTPEELAKREKEQKAQLDNYLQSIDKGVSEFNGFNTVLKDGELEIPINFSIGNEEKTSLKPFLQNFNVQDYFSKRWFNEDGTWNGKQQAEDVYWMENREKIMNKVATEAGSQRLAAHIKEAKNIDFNGGTQKGYKPNNVEPKEAMADFFFSQR